MTLIKRFQRGAIAPTNPPTGGGGEHPRIIRRDEIWTTAWFPYFGGLRWTSEYSQVAGAWVDANGMTGSLDYGPFVAGSQIHLAVAGGGATRGNNKTISVRRMSDNSPLVSVTLASIAPRDIGEPHPAQIATPGINGETVYLRFDDQDNVTAGWAWMGVDLSTILIED